MPKAVFVQEGDTIDYTPETAVAAGAVVVIGALVAIAKQAIAAATLGALAVRGTFDVAKVSGAISTGARVYWDADGDPVGGTAGTGAATTTQADGVFMGIAVAAAAETAETVRLRLCPPTDYVS